MVYGVIPSKLIKHSPENNIKLVNYTYSLTGRIFAFTRIIKL